MNKYLATLIALISLVACRPKPFEVKPTPAHAPFREEKPKAVNRSSLTTSQKEGSLTLDRYLPPSVDLLMSIYKTSSERGPVLVGRVLAKDGRLLAFRVMENAEHPSTLSTLMISLFEDTLNRL